MAGVEAWTLGEAWKTRGEEEAAWVLKTSHEELREETLVLEEADVGNEAPGEADVWNEAPGEADVENEAPGEADMGNVAPGEADE